MGSQDQHLNHGGGHFSRSMTSGRDGILQGADAMVRRADFESGRKHYSGSMPSDPDSIFQWPDSAMSGAMFAETYRNFLGALIAPVTFGPRFCCCHVTLADHNKTNRISSHDLPLMHRIGDASIEIVVSCLFLRIAVSDEHNPLLVVG